MHATHGNAEHVAWEARFRDDLSPGADYCIRPVMVMEADILRYR